MQEITLDYWEPDEYLKKCQKIFKGEIIDNNTITIDNDLLKGEIHIHVINKNLFVIGSHMDIHSDISFRRNSSDGPWIAFRFFISPNDLEIKQHESKDDILLNSINSMLLTSQHFEKNMTLKPGMRFKYLALFVNRNWLSEFFNSCEKEEYQSLLTSNIPLYHHSSVNYLICKTLDEFWTNTSGTSPMKHLLIESLTYDILCQSIKHFYTYNKHIGNLNPKDLKSLLEVEQYLAKSSDESPVRLQDLARKTAMSVSKFSKLFKTVFGKTLTQYQKDIKMERAMNLLASGEYCIAEVSEKLGYKNQSKFTAAFKAYYNMLPSALLKKS